MFEEFGVSAAAEELYLRMVRGASDHLGTPTAADDGFRELLAAGLVTPTDDGSAHTVVPPEHALEILISREEAMLESRRRRLHEKRTAVPGLVAEFVASRRRLVASAVEQMQGAEAVRARLFQLAAAATRQVWTVNTGPAPSGRSVEASRRHDQDLRARSVRSRAVFSEQAATDREFAAYLAEVAGAGDLVRTHPAPPIQMLLFDDDVAVVPAEGGVGAGAYVVHGVALVAPLQALFELVWQASAPLPRGAVGDDPVELARAREVVTLLAAGHKDETVARRLGTSARTVRRLVALAAEHLHAESRLQLGVLAMQHGWLQQDVVVPRPRRGGADATWESAAAVGLHRGAGSRSARVLARSDTVGARGGPMNPTTDRERLARALDDVAFPADKDALLAGAQRNGADDDTVRALRAVPVVDYRSIGEVLASVQGPPAEEDRATGHPPSPIVEELGENRGS